MIYFLGKFESEEKQEVLQLDTSSLVLINY